MKHSTIAGAVLLTAALCGASAAWADNSPGDGPAQVTGHEHGPAHEHGRGQGPKHGRGHGGGHDAVPALLAELAKYREEEADTAAHIATFDTLDFDVFTHQQWDRLHESHAQDIVVHWPDGHQTVGIDTHIADLKSMFVYAPDTRIETHPIKFGKGEWSAVIGVMEGTFSQPMPTADGGSIAPTGKRFKFSMSTIGHWRDGVMDEEYLFWDQASFLKQIGLAK